MTRDSDYVGGVAHVIGGSVVVKDTTFGADLFTRETKTLTEVDYLLDVADVVTAQRTVSALAAISTDLDVISCSFDGLRANVGGAVAAASSFSRSSSAP